MRYHEITPPESHPHVAIISIDPVHYRHLRRMAADEPELKYLRDDQSVPDEWTVWIGCASRAVADRLEDMDWQ